MKRRDFIKQLGVYPLAVQGIATDLVAAKRLLRRWRLTSPPFVYKANGRSWTFPVGGNFAWMLQTLALTAGGSRPSLPAPSAHDLAIEVPSIWQQYVDEAGGIGWYLKVFSLKKETLSRGLRLRFGAVDYRARCGSTAKSLVVHEGGFTPFEFDVRHAAK